MSFRCRQTGIIRLTILLAGSNLERFREGMVNVRQLEISQHVRMGFAETRRWFDN